MIIFHISLFRITSLATKRLQSIKDRYTKPYKNNKKTNCTELKLSFFDNQMMAPIGSPIIK
jgi:hypothetical protein